MSRTKRKNPYWMEIDLDRNWPWDQRILRGADGIWRKYRGMPSSRCPKGYNTFDEVGPSASHWAKKAASRVRRRQAKKEIQEILDDYDIG